VLVGLVSFADRSKTATSGPPTSTIALVLTQSLTEISIFLGGKASPARKADNLNDICESIV
jgi:hypothetical protein